MSGISRAVSKSQQLIWIFDQYFWSLPLARQLNEQLKSTATLRVIVLLPPVRRHESRRSSTRRGSRRSTSSSANVGAQVGVYNLWDPEAAPPRRLLPRQGADVRLEAC